MKAKSFISTFVSLVVLTTLVGCSTQPTSGDGSQPGHPFYALLLDRSGSTEQTGQMYGDYIVRFVKSLPPDSKLVTGLITSDPLSGDKIGLESFQLPGESWKLHDDVRINQIKSSVVKKVDTMFEKNAGDKSTGFMDSIRAISDAFPKDRSEGITLVIFSDSMETKRFDLYSTAGQLTDSKISELVDNEKSEGRLPDLSNTKVIIDSAATGDETVSVQVRDNVKKLWQAYIKAAGGELVEFSPSPLTF